MPDAYGEQLAAWGKVVMLETTGRVSGRPRRTAVGFVEEPDGSLLVAAGSPASDWAANLLVEPACQGTIGQERRAYRAEEIEGPERAQAITGLILRYGTPAESLGAGPAFRLRPVTSVEDVAPGSDEAPAADDPPAGHVPPGSHEAPAGDAAPPGTS